MKTTYLPHLQLSVRSTLSVLFAFHVFAAAARAADWPMFGRDQTRNAVSPEKNPPVSWDVKAGHSIKWKARIGGYTFAAPVVAKGLVWIGTNNEHPRDLGIKGPAGVLMCFRESDGQFLYQHVSPARQGPTYGQAQTGISCSPLIEGDRLWFVTTSAETVCLDIGPLHRGEGLPKEVWKLDMMDDLGVYPRRAVMGGGNLCSIPASHGDLIYVSTGNGTDWSSKNVPSPFAPALLCLNKNTGKLVWEDHSSGANILFAEWGNPLVIEVNGHGQVIAPQGDGWIRSLDALTGKLIWKFDINPKNGKWPETKGFFSTAPVFYGGRIYIAIGNYIEFGDSFPGRLVCLDPTKEGDISLEQEDGPGRGKPNPNSGAVWHFDGMRRSMATVAIKDDLLIAPDFSGIVHCLDAVNGRTYWRHDMRAWICSSPLIADGKIYVGDGDGDFCVLRLSKEKTVLAEQEMGEWVGSSLIFANGTLYLVAGDTLHAIEAKTSADWPQWRGLDRSNVSRETGLLKEWPTNGPPLLWTVKGLGTGIASVSVAAGRVYTIGYRDQSEFVHALDASTGESRWSSRVGPAMNENPLMRWLSQRTPTIDDGRLYTMTGSGDLICLQTSDGKKVWQKSYPNDFLAKRRTWGYCDYPLVDGDKLICSPVGPGATVVALNKRTGEMLWRTEVPGDEGAGYAAAVVSEGAGIRHYVFFLQNALAGIAADDGRVLWRYSKTAVRTAVSYTPIIRGDCVFSANGYGGGMALLKLVSEGDGIRAEEQYHQKFNFTPFQDSTILVNDHVYGFQSGSQPVCFELKTGQPAWGPLRTSLPGRMALTCADGHLYLRHSSGRMTLVEATPTAYVEKGSFQIPEREEASGVTSPVVAGGRLYLRDNNRLLCYHLAADALASPLREPKTLELHRPSVGLGAGQAEAIRPRVGKDRAPDAIYVPTPEDIVEEMLKLAAVKKEDVVYDLGSGDGRIVIAAASKFGSKTVGYEIDRRLVEQARGNVAQSKVESLARIEHEDIFTLDLSGADVIAVYLPSPLMQRLIPQFEKLKPGSRIVSHQFEMPGIRADKVITLQSKEDSDQHRIYLWTTPLKKGL